MASKNEMNQIMKQVQQMQADMMATQEKLASETVEASVGGGAVKSCGDEDRDGLPRDSRALEPGQNRRQGLLVRRRASDIAHGDSGAGLARG